MVARNEGRPRTGEEYEWMMHAACRGMGDDLFPEASAQQSARGICTKCPVRRECLAVALDDRIEWGIWGGMTERERRALLRERPGVKSWWDAFGLNTIKATLSGGGSGTAPGRTVRTTSFGTTRIGVAKTGRLAGDSPFPATQNGHHTQGTGYGAAPAHRGTRQGHA